MAKQDAEGSKHAFWKSLGGVLTSIATLITAVVTAYQIVKGPSTESACDEPLVWDSELQTCVKTFVVPDKTFSILLARPIKELSGNIFFYINRQRRCDEDRANVSAPGVVQVFVAVMHGKQLVGKQCEVIYSTDEGNVCKLSSQPETTGHLKERNVTYNLNLGTDCLAPDGSCRAHLVQSGNRVSITLKSFTVTISGDCKY